MSVLESIQKRIEALPKGEPFTSSELLAPNAGRSLVDKQLFKLNKTGVIQRVARGVYVKPRENRFVGKVMPGLMEVVQAKVGAGIKIAPTGAQAANHFGLTTQVPMSPMFYTSGFPKQFRFGQQLVKLIPVSHRKLVHAGTTVGLAISALWYLGEKEVTPEVIYKVKVQLTETEYSQLKNSIQDMPEWLVKKLNA